MTRKRPINSYDAENEIREALLSVGLSAREIQIFICLCNLGPQPGSVIAKNLEMKRTTVYHCLQRLVEKGFVYAEKQSSITCFHICPMNEAIKHLDLQREDLDHQKANLMRLSTILNQVVSSSPSPQTHLHEYKTLSEIKQLKMLTLKRDSDICIFASPNSEGRVLNFDDYRFWQQFQRKLESQSVRLRIIVPDNVNAANYQKKFYSANVLIKAVPQTVFPVSETLELNILQDEVVIFGPHSGSRIENKELANLQRATFELAWSGAEAIQSSAKKKHFFI